MLEKVFKFPPCLEMSTGQSSHLYQIFIMPDSIRSTSPTVQELLEKSFHDFGIKLKKIPQVLILQMPRYGSDRVFERIIPSPVLNITNLIESGIELL